MVLMHCHICYIGTPVTPVVPLLNLRLCYIHPTDVCLLLCQKNGIWPFIVPVFKKGPATDVANYRPISLTCVSSKIMERIIVDQMTSFLLQTGIINQIQHGFLRGLSASTNLSSII